MEMFYTFVAMKGTEQLPEPTTVGQRFTQLIAHLGISKNAFAASLGKTATVIQHLVDERNKPGFELLGAVFKVYPNVSKDWLMEGMGPMLKEPAASGAPSPEPAAAAPKPPTFTQPKVAPAAASEKVATPAAPAAAEVATPASAPLPPEPVVTPAPAVAAPSAAPVTASAAPIAAAPAVAPVAPVVAAPSVVPAGPAPTTDAHWQTALYTQQMAHQLALAELRNQHLQDQQRLMQQMLDMMQRQLPR